MDAFDTDVLIFAAIPDHDLGRRVLALFDRDAPVGVGSVLLLPEVLSKPTRLGDAQQVDELLSILGQIELLDVDLPTARAATELGAIYQLRAADATHLATAVAAGADRFITNNRRDFPQTIAEIDITYPDDLPEPEEPDHG